MKIKHLLLAGALAFAPMSMAHAVTLYSSVGPWDTPDNQIMNIDWTNSGTGFTLTGDGQILSSSISGVAAFPTGSPIPNFLVVPYDQSSGWAQVDFTGPVPGGLEAIKQLQFYLGSVDLYNSFDVIGTGGTSIFHFTGADLQPPAATGAQDALGARNVYLNMGAGEVATGLRITSNGRAAEIGPISGAVPEPATWAMMILGFGMTGAMIRRRRPALQLAV